MKRWLLAALFTMSFGVPAFGQALAPTITKSFNPPVVLLNDNSDATITVTNPNAFPILNVQFSDTMPAGVTLITQVGGTCSTLATGGGMFSINPGTGTFSSTSSVLAGGQSCNIVVRVQGTALGVHLNTTSQVTATATPPGGPASATLTVISASSPAVPTLSEWMLLALAAVLAGMAALKLRT
ncbi:MAG TPA: IPTL-CTERM sorting domain-containing protein [Thermoanaerobaculia bacterium]|nr:IPTL-CTERM sorting domain-containing protein [Thermoanaerobaculia bacterium]